MHNGAKSLNSVVGESFSFNYFDLNKILLCFQLQIIINRKFNEKILKSETKKYY